jgi:uncharacterized protein YjlB
MEERTDQMDIQVQSFFLKEDGQIPNNPTLPVIFYQNAFDGEDGGRSPEEIEAAFNSHGWTNSWTGDVYDYLHYHSNTHEVLGVRRGTGTILAGGDSGQRLDVKPGDVVLLPAGTGHMKVESTDDFEVVGAYPLGAEPNLTDRDPAKAAQAKNTISNVGIPEQDPVFGDDDQSPLLHKWVK